MSIVCTTNLSEQARTATLAAAHLAAATKQKLYLLHVIPGPLAQAAGAGLAGTLRGILEDEADRVASIGARVEVDIREGRLPEELAKYAREKDAHWLIAGANRAETAWGGMGGNLERIADSASVPLLVIKNAKPWEDWARGRRPLKVVIGADRSAPFGAAREFVAELRKVGPVVLVAARVFYPPQELARFGLPAPYSAEEIPPLLEESLIREVTTLVGPQPDGMPVTVRLQPSLGREADPLVGIAQNEAADLIVVGTHHRRGVARLWSVSHHALRLAPMSVVAVPSTAAHVEHQPLPALRTVLVTTDLSPAGDAAVRWAFSISDERAVVHLLHLVPAELTPADRAPLLAHLERLIPAEELKGERIALPEVLTANDPATGILQAAERLNVDAICIASHGRSAVFSALLGSVVTKVMRTSRRPLLVVPPLER